MKFIKDEDIAEFLQYTIQSLISKFSDELKIEVIESKELQEKIQSDSSYITNLISTMEKGKKLWEAT